VDGGGARSGDDRNNARGAFTLVELMVVVAIIGLLMVIALPVIGRALEQARQADCANNLRQFSVAVVVYRNDRAAEPIPTPPWLSNLYPNYMSSPSSYVCRTDRSRGKEGGRPDGVFEDDFAETDDTEFNPAGATAYGRNSDIKRCSYMYEFSAAPCSWGWSSYLGASLAEVDRNGDGLASWSEVKTYQLRNGDEWNKHQAYGETMFPLIRCFHHHAFKKVQTPSGLQAWTLNVAYAGNVFESPLFWEYSYSPP
jgi:prepilin-type N-terminal cleavage/methylation domain-containing protein